MSEQTAEVTDEVVKTENSLKPRTKFCYVGAPAKFILEQACQNLHDAFGEYGIYLVGSVLERPDWRDVDLRYIMSDEGFAKLFPDSGPNGQWEHDPRWLLLTVLISEHLTKISGLPIDFQFQPQIHANNRHKGKRRDAMGLRFMKPDRSE